MANSTDEPPSKQKRRRQRTPEEVWIQAFLEFSGTDNVTLFNQDDLNGVSLVRAVMVLCRGDCTRTEKANGPGAICTFVDLDDGELVEVVVFFIASENTLEIWGARVIKENGDDTNAA